MKKIRLLTLAMAMALFLVPAASYAILDVGVYGAHNTASRVLSHPAHLGPT